MTVLRRSMLGLVAVATVGATATLQAQSVAIDFTTFGCFFTPQPGSPPVNCTGPQTGLSSNIGGPNGLTYVPNTAPGFVGVADPTQGIGGSGHDNFGNLNLGGTLQTIPAGATFDLFIVFSSPLASNTLFTAAVTGQVKAGPTGNVKVTFNPDFISGIPYTGGQPGNTTGTMEIDINNVNLTPGGLEQAISGSITVTPTTSTPEPATLGLMAMGLVGLVPVIRRRRSK